ncbi:MAG: CoA pyrophosphatase [Chloroflexi bacterium]|nr:CoA pyrophosphatase [Chloroflexota bacterium]
MRTSAATGPEALPEALRQILTRRRPADEASDGASPAAVLVPLQHHDGRWHVILNVRSETVGEHKGEVAFPGGRLEPADADMVACALRETWEEMGIRPEDVDVLGPLDAVMTRTNYLVWPTVGVVPHPYAFAPNAREVAAVIEAPVDELLEPGAARHEARVMPDGTVRKRVAYVCGDHLIFGATAWILEQLLGFIAQSPDTGGAA